jgi:hypothetical protein
LSYGQLKLLGIASQIGISRGTQAPVASSIEVVVDRGSLGYRIQGNQRVNGSFWAQLNENLARRIKEKKKKVLQLSNCLN